MRAAIRYLLEAAGKELVNFMIFIQFYMTQNISASSPTASNKAKTPDSDARLISAFSSLLSVLLVVPEPATADAVKLPLARGAIDAVEKCDWTEVGSKVSVYARALQMLSVACRPVYPYHIGIWCKIALE